MKWSELIGKKVLAFRGHILNVFDKDIVVLVYILFDDGETFIRLEEQDKYDYHDCNSSARVLSLFKNSQKWNTMFDQRDGYVECQPGHDPF